LHRRIKRNCESVVFAFEWFCIAIVRRVPDTYFLLLEPERRNGGFWDKSWVFLGEQLRNRVTQMLKRSGFSSVDFKWAKSILTFFQPKKSSTGTIPWRQIAPQFQI